MANCDIKPEDQINTHALDLSEAEVIKLVGTRAVWTTELAAVITRKTSMGVPLSFPRRAFLSYRWGDSAKHSFVSAIADELWNLGYIVFHDRQIASGEHPPSVPELVGMIANCDRYLALIDQGFTDRVGAGGPTPETISDGWVYDELNTAFILERAERIQIRGLYIEDCELPRGGFGVQYPIFDFRDHSKLDELLAHFFAYEAPPVKSLDVAKLVSLDEAFLYALYNRDRAKAKAIAQEMIAWNDQIPDGHFRLLLATLAQGDLRGTITSAIHLQKVFPGLVELGPVLNVARCRLQGS